MSEMSEVSEDNRKQIIEAALFSSTEPLSIDRLQLLFDGRKNISAADMKTLLAEIEKDYEDRGVNLQQVASGYRFQASEKYSTWLQKLWQKKPPRYSRALFETLALVAYRQPVTRAEIEEVRGVAVSSNIIKILQDREWIKVVGHRDVPGKPALFGTTKVFLDYFNLQKLSDLPPLSEVANLEEAEKKLNEQLSLAISPKETAESEQTSEDVETAETTNPDVGAQHAAPAETSAPAETEKNTETTTTEKTSEDVETAELAEEAETTETAEMVEATETTNPDVGAQHAAPAETSAPAETEKNTEATTTEKTSEDVETAELAETAETTETAEAVEVEETTNPDIGAQHAAPAETSASAETVKNTETTTTAETEETSTSTLCEATASYDEN